MGTAKYNAQYFRQQFISREMFRSSCAEPTSICWSTASETLADHARVVELQRSHVSRSCRNDLGKSSLPA